MSGITDLGTLLSELSPALADGEFVFCSIEDASREAVADLDPVGTFREREGLTVILPAEEAAGRGLEASAPMRMITLEVASALEAVGLTAAVSGALTTAGISANVVAAFHHDHAFVPTGDAERALAVLRGLAGE